jgi:hypothetical protein
MLLTKVNYISNQSEIVQKCIVIRLFFQPYIERVVVNLQYNGFVVFEGDDWIPADTGDFGVFLDFYVGKDGAEGGDAFMVLVCSQIWYARERGAVITSGRNIIFMPKFDRQAIDDFLRAKCSEETGKGVEATMLKIDGLGEWEYRYRS